VKITRWPLRLAALALGGLALTSTPARAEQVFFGVSDRWQDLVTDASQWTYVQKHADGFYINFLMLNRAIHNQHGVSLATLSQTCALFATHTAYIESDMRAGEASTEREQQYIQVLHQAGCKVAYSSLNYGWSPDRAQNLSTFELNASESRRLNFVQVAPWLINGDISGPSMASRPGYNEKVRGYILAADGFSTDGPLGYFATDFAHFRAGEISLVRFAHQNGKKAVIMISPYGAKVRADAYDPTRDLLATGQALVRMHETEHAVPDIWAILQYATDIVTTPEQIDGKPANTVTGLAYWLIQHVHDPGRVAKLKLAAPAGGATSADVTLRNESTWLDLAPVLHLTLHDAGGRYAATLRYDGRDITEQAASAGGVALTGPAELQPGARHRLSLTLVRNGPAVGVSSILRDAAAPASAGPFAELTLAPNPNAAGEIHQTLIVRPTNS
jgi:hypothetical protein